jgi:hypothetical protein
VAGATVGVAENQTVVRDNSTTQDNPLNSMKRADPKNPASPMNRGTTGVLVQPALTQDPQPEA